MKDMEPREQLLQTLIKHFINDLSTSIKPFEKEEAIQFIGILIEYLKGVFNNDPDTEYNYDGNPFDEDEFIETKLLEPYREKMIPFVKTSLRYYFSKDEFTQSELFHKLHINEDLLTEEEYEQYILRLYVLLRSIKQNLYLRPIKQNLQDEAEAQKLINNPDELIRQGFKSKSTQYTRSRQILLYYFVLKLMGITKLQNSSRKLAQFAHVLFAYPIDNIDNSAIYKLLKKAPYLKKDTKTMLDDLEFVKQQFELIDSFEGITLVQKEIDLLKR